jgi:hypothetical protein
VQICVGNFTEAALDRADGVLRLKISVDGFQKKGSRLIGTICILDSDHPHALYSTFNICSAIAPEDGQHIDALLTPMLDELERLVKEGVTVTFKDGAPRRLNVEYYISADQKALLAILGLTSPISKFFCAW